MAHLLDELLLKQPEAFVELVYAEPAAVLSIYQRLSGPARHLLLRFLYQPDATLDKKQFAAYFLKDEDAETVRIELTQRFLLKTMTDGMLTFGSVFLDSLRTALAGRTDAPDQAMPPPKKASEVTPAFLEEHSRVSWEAILSYMTTNAELKNSTMILILQEAQLIVNDQPPISVTPEGFQFLLQDRANQVWLLIVTFLKLLSREEPIPGEGLPMHEALVLLFRIGLGRLNEEFSAENLTTMQITFLRQLHYMGVVYHRNRKSKRFFLTPYAVMLYHNAELALSQTETGFLLAETNFHVYAYTDSAVKVALLSKFATLTYRLPIMTTAIITRTSVRRALSQGITADQILRFMQVHASPMMRAKNKNPNDPFAPVPGTVRDQIKLWEDESNRLTKLDATLIRYLPNVPQLFEDVTAFAREHGLLIWSTSLPQKVFVIHSHGKKEVKQYYRKRLEQLKAKETVDLTTAAGESSESAATKTTGPPAEEVEELVLDF